MMSDTRKRDLAKIHLAKKDLAMAEESYRALLQRVTGKDSAAALDVAQRTRVLTEMARLGWRPKRTRRYSPKTRDKRSKTVADKIRALWIDMSKSRVIRDGSEAALGRWLHRQCGKYSPDWLDDGEAYQAIEALKKWRDRG